ncbi:competence protein ComK [Pontibacillus litoralis]|uniref:Competence protein n=1 Tax=Pontibacillus litoralis JSM 072002 TaxID=1385512 RepID=A0A0A5G2T3_9BACI|nr:competence protein ComK [Pontibacillus litoralis]KGX86354.1 hypothetical protein N784_05230 [Pontibacillus litoralis JSM 072002]
MIMDGNHYRSKEERGLIGPNTMMIVASPQETYQTKITDKVEGDIYVSATPQEVILSACLEGFSDYEGRRLATINRTEYKKKVPIAIHPQQDIFAFPTQSSKQPNCVWLFASHIKDIAENGTKHVIIHFQNGTTTQLPVSKYVIKKQMERTSYCRFLYQQLYDK